MKKLWLTGVSVLLLAACGGGGAGSATTPDGTKINLDISSKGEVSGKTDNGKLEGYNNNHSFYGVWLDDSKQLKELRYQGTVTADREVPRSGQATYIGSAVRLDSLTKDILTDGTSRIDVDFGEKTVKGEIDMPFPRRDITLHEGRLNGASYSGNASVLGNSSGSYQGGLFGPNAAETAGIVQFDTNHDLDTVFGGKKY